ncbi:MAG: hypothetical protein WBW71_02275 [Bacteroidota bacterium]
MEYTSRLRSHLGESAYLIDVHPGYLVDFTKTRRGEEITLIEVGGHGITVEFVASGEKHIFTFDQIQVKERMSGKLRTPKNGYHRSGKSV